MADFDLFIYFSVNSEETTLWDSEFSYHLGLVLKQVLDSPPKVISNINVPGVIQKKTNDLHRTGDLKAFILVIGNETPQQTAELKQFVNNLSGEQRKKILLVQRPLKQLSQLPDFLLAYSLYSFFEVNSHTNQILEFSSRENGSYENNFWEKITDLAYDLKFLLTTPEKQEISTSRTNTIFLAEVSSDQIRNRDRLKRELLQAGYHVLPEQPLPLTLKEFEDTVCSCLEKSILSVHIMGETYGISPDGTDYSYTEIQNRLFVDVAKRLQNFEDVQPKLSRIIWAQPVFEPYEDKQTQYIKRLKKEISISGNSEYNQTNLHELKNIIDQKLMLLQRPVSLAQAPPSDQMLLIADDYKDIAYTHIREEFEQVSMNITLFKSLAKIQDTENLMNELKKHKNVLILNTRNNRNWLFSVLNLLARSKGYANAVTHCIVGLFSPAQIKKIPELRMLEVDSYVYSSKNISTQLKSFFIKIKEA